MTIPTYRLPTTTDLDLPLQVSRLNGEESLQWDSIPDRHTFYAIFWLTAGGGVHHIDFEGHQIRPNALFLMRPGQTHFFAVTKPVAGYTIFFQEEFLLFDSFSQQFNKLFYLVEQHPALYPAEQDAVELTRLVKRLLEEFDANHFGRSQALQHLVQLVHIHILRIYNRLLIQRPEDASTHLTMEFQHLLGRHFAEFHRVKEYASLLGISANYLNIKVKATLGMPASSLIRRRLVMEAKRLLAHTEQSVSEIAYQVGFEDVSYFGRFFKRETNQTPLQFRRRYYKKYQKYEPKSL